ncbi:hypothetical protein N431DRAFT_435620 [Stipitochalara longipes BDJ]|nr:hypothetical protein N431DRAFT_435620 [Stipitochalara longipes BDJ]
MQFSTILLTAAALLTPTLATDGIFAITGTATAGDPTTVTLQVQNGLVGDAPTCSGTDSKGSLPVSGTVPCKSGYALSYSWDTIKDGIAATYTSPGNTFTYNVPNKGCDANNVCQFGFTDIFPGKKMRALRV